MRVRIDPDICIGCALCTQVCPEAFKMVADKAVVYISPIPPDLEDSCRKAVDDCPVTAIFIE